MRTVALGFLVFSVLISNVEATEVVLSRQGRLVQAVCVASKCGERTRKAATTLATYLDKITGGKCLVEEADDVDRFEKPSYHARRIWYGFGAAPWSKEEYAVEITDRGAGTRVEWLSDLPATIVSSTASPAHLFGRWDMYFYVPRGTTTIGLFADGPGKLLDPTGKLAFEFPAKAGYYSIPVPAGQDARLWRFTNTAGQRLLITVPPCLARDEKELLLPAEVVKQERLSQPGLGAQTRQRTQRAEQ